MTEYEARHGIADCVRDILFICWRRGICKSCSSLYMKKTAKLMLSQMRL